MDDIEESESLLTSAGVETEHEEDLSVYGKAYQAFGGGLEGKEACMALAALCEVASINTLLSNFIEPLQVYFLHIALAENTKFFLSTFNGTVTLVGLLLG